MSGVVDAAWGLLAQLVARAAALVTDEVLIVAAFALVSLVISWAFTQWHKTAISACSRWRRGRIRTEATLAGALPFAAMVLCWLPAGWPDRLAVVAVFSFPVGITAFLLFDVVFSWIQPRVERLRKRRAE